MHIRIRSMFAVATAMAVFAFFALVVATEGPAYAKGPVKSSGGGSGSSSDSRSSSGSGSSRSSDSGSSRSSNSGSSQSSSSSSSRSGSSSGRSSIESRVNQSPSPRSSSNSLDDSFYLRTPSSRYDSKRPTPTYRKDYAEIGDLWKNRQEKRDPRSSAGSWGRDGRNEGYYHGRDDRWRDSRSWGFSLYTSPFRFSYYCYDYRPTMCYPSPYCFYYDYCPPYVFYHRVNVIPRPIHHVYVEVPVFVYRSSSDYYLSNPSDKSLWAALRNIQTAWERSDVERLMKHVDRNATVDVYLHDEYTYSVNRLDYYEMTLDAMLAIRTRSFDFDRVNRIDSWRHEAHGTHVYTDRYGALKTVYVTYTFERRGSEWFITAVGTSTRPI